MGSRGIPASGQLKGQHTYTHTHPHHARTTHAFTHPSIPSVGMCVGVCMWVCMDGGRDRGEGIGPSRKLIYLSCHIVGPYPFPPIPSHTHTGIIGRQDTVSTIQILCDFITVYARNLFPLLFLSLSIIPNIFYLGVTLVSFPIKI